MLVGISHYWDFGKKFGFFSKDKLIFLVYNLIMDLILYILLAMVFWDFTIHIIDRHDRKYNFDERSWSGKMRKSKLIFSRYYPFFWGKDNQLNQKLGWEKYDRFWLTYWGTAIILLLIYIIFK